MLVFPYVYGGGTKQNFSFDTGGRFLYPEEVTVPNTVLTLAGSNALGFFNHTEIKRVTFEPGAQITGVATGSFQGCTNLEEVILPDSVTSIGASAFYGSGLISFTAPANLVTLQGFQNCTKLETVVLNEGLTSVRGNSFNGCTALEEIIMPSTLTGLDGGAEFKGCTALKKVVFKSVPTGLFTTANNNHPFYNCKAIEEFVIPEGWNSDLVVSNGSSYYTNVLTHDSMVAMIANLYDYSGGTAHTLTVGSTNLAKLSADEIAVATAKNWTIA